MWVLGKSRVGVTRERKQEVNLENKPSFPPGDKVPPQEFNSHSLGDSVFGLSRGGISSTHTKKKKTMRYSRNSMMVSQKFENRTATQCSDFTSGYINI